MRNKIECLIYKLSGFPGGASGLKKKKKKQKTCLPV